MNESAAPRSPLASFFLVPFQVKTWLNVLYLALAFPLGLAWFVVLVTGFSLGVGLAITLVGLPLLALLVLATRGCTAFERGLARVLTGVPIETAPTFTPSARAGAWNRLKAILGDGLTWRGLLYLVLRFPIGLAAFVVLVTVTAAVGACLSAPVTYALGTVEVGSWLVDTAGEAWLLFAIGAALVAPALHLLNAMARGMGELARVLTGGKGGVPPPQDMAAGSRFPDVTQTPRDGATSSDYALAPF